MKRLNYLFCIFILFSCGHNINATKTNIDKTAGHKTIAILPFEMSLNLNKKQQGIISEKDKAALSQSLSVDLEKKLYFMLAKYAAKHKLTIQVQNADETLTKLSANNTRFSDLHNADKSALLNILGVDAVLDPNMTITQQGAAFSIMLPFPLPAPYLGIATADVYNLNIDFNVSIKDLSADTAFWKYKSNQWYQAANKISKSKKEASNNFLAPLFLNVDDIFKAFISKQPYRKDQH